MSAGLSEKHGREIEHVIVTVPVPTKLPTGLWSWASEKALTMAPHLQLTSLVFCHVEELHQSWRQCVVRPI